MKNRFGTILGIKMVRDIPSLTNIRLRCQCVKAVFLDWSREHH